MFLSKNTFANELKEFYVVCMDIKTKKYTYPKDSENNYLKANEVKQDNQAIGLLNICLA
ncbi:hypothetical protein JCM31447_04410 [Fluviispira sanaruensis]|uniref:Uncharacterized protein n=1 Tax=Fluviispira sanaruensis TaxID=2493639 RepID=A0A4P2VJA9_FLUSA|nr:hypothetical protein JCM31447_04410 [Fluviispira sanaruensis]